MRRRLDIDDEDQEEDGQEAGDAKHDDAERRLHFGHAE